MSERIFAIIYGIVFIALGILGFIPKLTPNGYFLNSLATNAGFNVFYILTGIIALVVAVRSLYARVYFKTFGIVYLALAIIGFMLGGHLLLMPFNLADVLFYFITGAIAAFLGFGKVKN